MHSLSENLKKEREKKGITLEEAAKVTKIRKTYLQALEDGDFSVQSPVFMKGFLKSYAEFLGLNSTDIIRRYENEIMAVEEAEAESEKPAVQSKGSKYLSFIVIILSLGAFLIIASIILFIRWHKVPVSPPPVTEEKKEEQKVVETPASTPPVLTTTQEKPPSDLTSPAPVIKPASPPPTVTAKTPEVKPSVEAPAVKPIEATGKPAEKMAENGKAHVLSMTATGTAWLRITVDNGTATETVLKKGDTLELFAEREFVIVTGNAGEIELRLDGKPMGALGESGKVVSRVFPEGLTE